MKFNSKKLFASLLAVLFVFSFLPTIVLAAPTLVENQIQVLGKGTEINGATVKNGDTFTITMTMWADPNIDYFDSCLLALRYDPALIQYSSKSVDNENYNVQGPMTPGGAPGFPILTNALGFPAVNTSMTAPAYDGKLFTLTVTFKVIDADGLKENKGTKIEPFFYGDDCNIVKHGAGQFHLTYYQDYTEYGEEDSNLHPVFEDAIVTLYNLPATVSFDMQGHGTQIADVSTTTGSLITAPSAPSATGWTFGGWYKEAACTNAWDFAADKIMDDTTLYAKWTAKTPTSAVNYTIEHWQQNIDDDNFTKFETENKADAVGDTVNIMAKNYTGFTPDTTRTTINGAALPTPVVIADGDVIRIYYTRNIYTVSFIGNGNDGGTVPAPMTAKYGATITIPGATPTKTGFTFDYWLGSVVHPGDTYTVTGDKRFVAQWKSITAAPETGDNNMILLYAGIMLVSVAGVCVPVIRKKKKNLK